MGKLSKEQADQLAELERLRDAPDDDKDQDQDDAGVIVLRGKRADDFLGQIFGAGRKRTATAAEPDDGQADDEPEETADDGQADDEPEPDPQPKRGRFLT